MDPIVKYETNTPRVNVCLHKVDIPHNIIEVGEIAQRHADSAHRLPIDHVDLVGAAVLLQRQRLQHALRLLEILPAGSGIAVTPCADMNVLSGRFGLDLVISDVTPVGPQQIHRQNAALHVLVVGLMLAIDLHDRPSIATHHSNPSLPTNA